MLRPPRTKQCFPNNKPWITPAIKALLKDKKTAFRSGSREVMRAQEAEEKQPRGGGQLQKGDGGATTAAE